MKKFLVTFILSNFRSLLVWTFCYVETLGRDNWEQLTKQTHPSRNLSVPIIEFFVCPLFFPRQRKKFSYTDGIVSSVHERDQQIGNAAMFVATKWWWVRCKESRGKLLSIYHTEHCAHLTNRTITMIAVEISCQQSPPSSRRTFNVVSGLWLLDVQFMIPVSFLR